MPVRRIPAAAILLAAGLLATTAAAADWPQWRGPNRDAHSTDKGLLAEWPKAGPPLAWRVTDCGYGYSSPAVVGDRLFLLGTDPDSNNLGDYALCLGTKDGQKVWKVDLPPTDPKAGYNTGWGGGPRGTPTVDGDVLYALCPRGDLFCLKTADGSKVWSVNLVKDFGGGIPGWGYSESVLIDGDRLICTPGGSKGTVLALDKKTGKKVWQSEDLKDGAAYASLIPTEVGGVRQYVTQTNSSSVGVRAADGKLLWKFSALNRGVPAVIPTPVVADGYVFFTCGYNAGDELIKLEPDGAGGTKATSVYADKTGFSSHHGGVVRVGDYLYGSSGRWVCLEYKKQSKKSVWDSTKLSQGSVALADGNLYCYGQDGTVVLAAASPSGWEEKGRFKLPEKTKLKYGGGAIWAHPVVANGKLYLRDQNLLYCYDVSGKF